MSVNVSEKGNIDFTKGSIIQNMILFSVPIVLGELFQNFYNSVDALVVGNFVGKYALGAVSVCDTIARLLVGFFTGMSAGVSVATVGSQFLSVVLVCRKLRKTEDSFRICISEIPEEKALIGEVVNIGSTMLKLLIPFYLVMVVLRQLFLAIVMRHPRIEYIYAAFPLGWGLTAFMLMIYGYFQLYG